MPLRWGVRAAAGINDWDAAPLDGVGCKVGVLGLGIANAMVFGGYTPLCCMGHHCGAMAMPPTAEDRYGISAQPNAEKDDHNTQNGTRYSCCGVVESATVRDQNDLLAFTSHSDPSCCHFLIPASALPNPVEGRRRCSSLFAKSSIHCSSLFLFHLLTSALQFFCAPCHNISQREL